MTQSTQSRGRSYPTMMPLIGEPEGHRAPRYHPPLNQASVASGNTRRPTPAKRITTPAEARADERKRVAEVFASTAVEGRYQSAAALLTGTDMTAAAIVRTLACCGQDGDDPTYGAAADWADIHAAIAARRP